MNYTDDVHDLIIKVYSELPREDLLQLGLDIEEYLFLSRGYSKKEVNVNFYVVKEDAVR